MPTGPPEWNGRGLLLEDFEFLVLQSLHFGVLGTASEFSFHRSAKGGFTAAGVATGVMLGLIQFGVRPPPIYSQAMNAGVMWGGWLVSPLVFNWWSSGSGHLVPLAGLATLGGAAAMALWAHSGTLSQGQLSLIQSTGFWTAMIAFASPLRLMSSFQGYLGIIGATVVTSAVAGWLGQGTHLGREAELFLGLGAGAGFGLALAFEAITNQRFTASPSVNVAFAVLPVVGAALSLTMAHRLLPPRAQPTGGQLLPMFTSEAQGVAYAGRF